MEIPIKIEDFNDGKILTVEITINNKKSIMLLDTGASTSILDLRKLYKFTSVEPLKSFNVTSIQDNMESYNILINKIEIGNKKILNKNIQVIDLINLNNTFSTNNINVIDGILGNDILFDNISSIDLKNKVIILD
jgi:predicted aspartyl protease